MGVTRIAVPTKLDKIENFRDSVQVGGLADAEPIGSGPRFGQETRFAVKFGSRFSLR